MWAFFAHSCLRGGGIDVISADVVLWGGFLLVGDPRGGGWRRVWGEEGEQDKDKEGKEERGGGEVARSPLRQTTHYHEQSYPSTLRARIPWVLTLLVSLRLTNWKIGDPAHDRTQPTRPMTRRQYLAHVLKISLTSFFLIDTCAFFAMFDPWFRDRYGAVGIDFPVFGHYGATTTKSFFSPPPRLLSLVQHIPFAPRLLRTLAIGLQAYSLISLGGALPTLLVLPLNYLGLISDTWSPHTWPPFFGFLSAIPARGMRGLWGGWWHQTMRFTSFPGRAVSRTLGFDDEGKGKSDVTGWRLWLDYRDVDFGLRTLSAFFFSGVVHMGLVPPEPWFANMPAWKVRLFVAGFFWAQVPVFAIELLVERFARRWRLRPSFGSIDFGPGLVVCWVLVCLCVTIPILGVATKELGYWRVYPLPFSFWRGVMGWGWWPWASLERAE